MSSAPKDALGYKPPDGGWGWMVVFGAHISIGFAYSTPKALSIFFKEIQMDLGASYSEIAWISSIMLAVMYAGGLLVDVFGDYKYLFFMCGSVIVTGGLFLFVMNIYNYHMLDKEKAAKSNENGRKDVEDQDQDQAIASEVEMEQTEMNGAQRDVEDAETVEM